MDDPLIFDLSSNASSLYPSPSPQRSVRKTSREGMGGEITRRLLARLTFSLSGKIFLLFYELKMQSVCRVEELPFEILMRKVSRDAGRWKNFWLMNGAFFLSITTMMEVMYFFFFPKLTYRKRNDGSKESINDVSITAGFGKFIFVKVIETCWIVTMNGTVGNMLYLATKSSLVR